MQALARDSVKWPFFFSFLMNWLEGRRRTSIPCHEARVSKPVFLWTSGQWWHQRTRLDVALSRVDTLQWVIGKLIPWATLRDGLLIFWSRGERGQSPSQDCILCTLTPKALVYQIPNQWELSLRAEKLYWLLKDREWLVFWTDVVCQVAHYLDMEEHKNVVVFRSKRFLQLWLGFSDHQVLTLDDRCCPHLLQSQKSKAAQFHQFLFQIWEEVRKKRPNSE